MSISAGRISRRGWRVRDSRSEIGHGSVAAFIWHELSRIMKRKSFLYDSFWPGCLLFRNFCHYRIVNIKLQKNYWFHTRSYHKIIRQNKGLHYVQNYVINRTLCLKFYYFYFLIYKMINWNSIDILKILIQIIQNDVNTTSTK